MRTYPLLSAFALLVACGPAASPPASPQAAASVAPPTGPMVILSDATGEKRIATDVTFLASPALAGRGTGEEGARLARDFLVKRFTDLGLAPAGSADGKSFTQEFSARVGAKAEPPELSILGAGGLKKAIDPVAARVADGSATGEASAEAVFVGYGITAPAVGWDDYAGGDLAGKIAIILDGVPVLGAAVAPVAPAATDPKKPAAEKKPGDHAPDPTAPNPLRDFGAVRYKLRTAREHHASGVLLVIRGSLRDAASDASSMGVPAVVTTVDSIAPFFPGLDLAGKAVWAPTKSSPPKTLREKIALRARIEPVDAAAWNVAGLLHARPGAKHADEYVVLGAHYDHLGRGGAYSRSPTVRAIHPGADDNASGTALLLEAARRLEALPRGLERNVLFLAFGAEEIGTIGSRYWVAHPTVPLASVTAMINADMVGRLRDEHLIVDGTGTAAGWPEIIAGANAGLGLNLSLGAEGFGASDHTSFTEARVPVAFLFTGVHDDYHQPTDTADKINAVGEERVTTFAARLALAVAERPERLGFVDAPADPHRGMGNGFKVSLGTIPDYAFTGAGVRVSGLRPDAPADHGGMKAGDVIVKVGAHVIGNIHDYMYALGELEAGRVVTVEVERAGARLPLQIIPAPGR